MKAYNYFTIFLLLCLYIFNLLPPDWGIGVILLINLAVFVLLTALAIATERK